MGADYGFVFIGDAQRIEATLGVLAFAIAFNLRDCEFYQNDKADSEQGQHR